MDKNTIITWNGVIYILLKELTIECEFLITRHATNRKCRRYVYQLIKTDNIEVRKWGENVK